MKSLSHVRLVVTPWTAAHQAPPSMGFSRQEYWSGVPLLSPLSILGFLFSGKAASDIKGIKLPQNTSELLLHRHILT